MHALSYKAIAQVLKTQPVWILPLSSGLDSRLIAGVGADLGTTMHAYAYGEPDTTDVVYSRQIAKVLGIPWKRIELEEDFLLKYTSQWADLFGSSMHFHGMYQMAFLDAIQSEPHAPVVSGYIGDILSGDGLHELSMVHTPPGSYQLVDEWYVHWIADETRSLLKIPIDSALEANADEIRKQINTFPGARFQNLQYLELWGRQRSFTYFQSALAGYWRGVCTPFINRDYARFSMSLPLAALDNRRLLKDVYRRHYGLLATIPGTYADKPFIPTGRFLLKQRFVKLLPSSLRRGPFTLSLDTQLRMDTTSLQAAGKEAVWPIYDNWDRLSEWLDVNELEKLYNSLRNSKEDIRPLRKLQSVQTLAYRLLNV
jgi:hypothetical protein